MCCVVLCVSFSTVEQIAFADRILLNKIDLVSAEELANIKSRIKVSCFLALLLALHGVKIVQGQSLHAGHDACLKCSIVELLEP
jgi:G3E family GTPase